MPEIRRDPVSGRWTIVASTRTERPSDFASGKISKSKKNCPFCPGNEEQTPPEIYCVKSSKENAWRLRVVPNKYPALIPSLDAECLKSEGLYKRMEGIGNHEVIIETPDHFRQLHEMAEEDIAEVFKCFVLRIREIKKDKKIKYIMIFKNYGRHAGASLAHPHSQLIAMPMVPMRVEGELDGAKTYFSQKNSCVFCDMIREEISFKKRIVEENDFFIAINPYASRFTFETWILPKKHLSHLENTQEDYLKNLAGVLKSTVKKINHSLGDTSYNILIHTMPAQEGASDFYHWHIEIMPKFSYMAGFEWGTGFYINTVAPERATEILNLGKIYDK